MGLHSARAGRRGHPLDDGMLRLTSTSRSRDLPREGASQDGGSRGGPGARWGCGGMGWLVVWVCVRGGGGWEGVSVRWWRWWGPAGPMAPAPALPRPRRLASPLT